MKSVNTPKINVAKDENRNFHIYNMVSEQFDKRKNLEIVKKSNEIMQI